MVFCIVFIEAGMLSEATMALGVMGFISFLFVLDLSEIQHVALDKLDESAQCLSALHWTWCSIMMA